MRERKSRDVSCARFSLSSLARAREWGRRKKLHFAIRADSRCARFVNAPLFSFILLLSFFSWRYKMIFVSRKSENGRWMKRRRRERTDKGGSSTPGSFDSRGRVSSLFFLALFFVVVVFLHGRRSQRRRRMERATLGKIPAIQFFETEFSTSGVWLAQKREFFLFFFWSREESKQISA
jgi:hypothetical protein